MYNPKTAAYRVCMFSLNVQLLNLFLLWFFKFHCLLMLLSTIVAVKVIVKVCKSFKCDASSPNAEIRCWFDFFLSHHMLLLENIQHAFWLKCIVQT